jgi:hypothetical protein
MSRTIPEEAGSVPSATGRTDRQCGQLSGLAHFFYDQLNNNNPYLHWFPPRGYRPDHDFLEFLSLADGKDICQGNIGG